MGNDAFILTHSATPITTEITELSWKSSPVLLSLKGETKQGSYFPTITRVHTQFLNGGKLFSAQLQKTKKVLFPIYKAIIRSCIAVKICLKPMFYYTKSHSKNISLFCGISTLIFKFKERKLQEVKGVSALCSHIQRTNWKINISKLAGNLYSE